MFFGYYLSAAVMVAGENGEPVPEFVRRITVASPGRDPAAELAGVLTTMPDAAAHDQKTAELTRYKLGVHAAEDTDGYRRHVRLTGVTPLMPWLACLTVVRNQRTRHSRRAAPRPHPPRTAPQPGTSPRKPKTQDQLSSATRMSDPNVNMEPGEV
jgi:hypothetical protein